MSATLSILVIEIATVLMSIVCVFVFFGWKRKKRRGNEFDQLLEGINSHQNERLAQLMQYLMKDHALPEDEAKESSEYMIEAEKQFLQQFIKQQIEQTPVTEFYDNLRELLDQYLYFVPKKDLENTSSTEKELVEQVVEKSEAPKPNAYNSFADPDSKVKKVTVVKKNKVVEAAEIEKAAAAAQEQEEAEPDWGDAFAESGDAMDEDTKEGYEAGLNK